MKSIIKTVRTPEFYIPVFLGTVAGMAFVIVTQHGFIKFQDSCIREAIDLLEANDIVIPR